MSERTYIHRMYEQSEIDHFERFGQLAVREGETVQTIINSLINSWLKVKDDGIVLVSEKELQESLLAEGITVNRSTMKYFRDRNKLQIGSKCLWFANGQNILYDLKGCIRFFLERKRKQQKSSRLEKIA